MNKSNQYEKFMKDVYEHGVSKSDRTGTGTRSLFGYQMRFNLQEGFPLVTTKKLHTRSIIHELLWFLRGDSNIKYLHDNKVTIWDEWADENGDLGPVYGVQWRSWPAADGRHIDQISNVIEQIKTNPGFPPTRRVGLERRRGGQDGASALSYVLPVLRRRGQAVLSALSEKLRHFPRRSVQYRQLLAAHLYDRAAVRS